MTLENCPKCEKKLLPPFASSGRQVCSGCGWSDKTKDAKLNKLEPILESNANNYSESDAIGNSTMKINQEIVEIKGTPAQVWGNMLIPARGRITVQITGDTLLGKVKTGLEKKESWIRIQNIDSVEILEAPIYALLGLGGFLVLSGLGTLASSFEFGLILILGGIAIIHFALNNKRRCLVIYSHRNTIAVFMNKSPETYQQFSMNVLAIARQLNKSIESLAGLPDDAIALTTTTTDLH